MSCGVYLRLISYYFCTTYNYEKYLPYITWGRQFCEKKTNTEREYSTNATITSITTTTHV